MTTLGCVGRVVQVDNQVDCGLFNGRKGSSIGRGPVDLAILEQSSNALVKVCLVPVAHGIDH